MEIAIHRELMTAIRLFPRYARPLVLEALADTRSSSLVVHGRWARARLPGRLRRRIIPRGVQPRRPSDARGGAGGSGRIIAGLNAPTFIDEVHRAPDLLLGIKDVVDRDRTPGRFLL